MESSSKSIAPICKRCARVCCVVYAMWRFEASPLIASVKANPASSRHQQCKNHGDHGLQPFYRAWVQPPAPDSVHRLEASLEAGTLVIRLDGRPVLRGGGRYVGSERWRLGSTQRQRRLRDPGLRSRLT